MKRKATDIKELIEPENIKARIHALPHLKIKALGSFLYLTGARISEVVRFKKINYDGIRTNQIVELDIDGRKFLVIKKIPCLKREEIIYRNIPILFEENIELITYILQYKKQRELEEPPDYKNPQTAKYPVLFNMCRQGAWKMVNRYFTWFNHFFRHLRSTHLAEKHNFTAFDLKEYHGWTTISPADHYVHLNYMHIAKKMN